MTSLTTVVVEHGVARSLVDTNILVYAQDRWFTARSSARWATCSLTQLGFVRIISNPAFSRDALAPAKAVALLAENLAHPAHEFWTEDLQVPAAVKRIEPALQGHRQVTDAYLLALASRHKGLLASFDRGLRTLAGNTFDSALEIVPTR